MFDFWNKAISPDSQFLKDLIVLENFQVIPLIKLYFLYKKKAFQLNTEIGCFLGSENPKCITIYLYGFEALDPNKKLKECFVVLKSMQASELFFHMNFENPEHNIMLQLTEEALNIPESKYIKDAVIKKLKELLLPFIFAELVAYDANKLFESRMSTLSKDIEAFQNLVKEDS